MTDLEMAELHDLGGNLSFNTLVMLGDKYYELIDARKHLCNETRSYTSDNLETALLTAKVLIKKYRLVLGFYDRQGREGVLTKDVRITRREVTY